MLRAADRGLKAGRHVLGINPCDDSCAVVSGASRMLAAPPPRRPASIAFQYVLIAIISIYHTALSCPAIHCCTAGFWVAGCTARLLWSRLFRSSRAASACIIKAGFANYPLYRQVLPPFLHSRPPLPVTRPDFFQSGSHEETQGNLG